MIIIKCFGIDSIVVGNYSKKYIPLVKERFDISDEFIVIAPDEYIFHNGVEQTSWQGILEVIISPKYKVFEKELAHALLSYFAVEVVNVRAYFNYIDEKSFYVLENKDYPPFIVDDGKEVAQDVEPYIGDVFEDFELRARPSGYSTEEDDEAPVHNHNHDDEDHLH